MAALADGQYELDGTLLFGNGTLIRVQHTEYDPGAMTTQDAAVINGDGVRMGTDVLAAATLTITGIITAGNGQASTALDLYDQLADAWLNEDLRAVPGAYSTLRIRYPGSAATRALFGRGRKIAPSLGQVRQGLIGFVAQFTCATPWFYGDTDQSLTLSMFPSDTGLAGQTQVHNRYLNPDFGTDAASWTGVNCALARDASRYHTAAGSLKITPTGGLSGVYASGNLDNGDLINTARAYTNALWVLAPATISVQVQASIAWLNAGGAVISSSTGAAATLAANTWTLLTAPGVPPSTAVRADPRLLYAGTPLAADVIYLDDTAFTENLGGIAPPVTPPVTLGGTAETAAGISNVAGLRKAWPVFTITGPVSYPRITYTGLGPWVQLITSIAAGQYATIDTRPWVRSVLRSDGASLAGYLRGSTLSGLALPAGAQTQIRYSGQDPTGTSRLTLAWRTVTGSIGGSA